MAMTLTDLLALLPDNTAGAIDADDLRTIVTELFNSTAALQTATNDNAGAISNNAVVMGTLGGQVSDLQTDVATLDARVTTLEDAGHSASQSFSYKWATNGAAPSNGHMTMDQPWQTFASKALMSEVADNGEAPSWLAVDTAVTLVAWLTTADGAKMKCTALGPSVDRGSYREIPISVESMNGDPPSNNEVVTVTFIAVVPS